MSAGVNPLVQDIGFCLLGAGVLSVAFERIRLPHVAAFLAAGVAVGPVGASLVTDVHNIETIAQLGLTLLLFLIGLEVDVKNLLASGRALVVGGLLQVPLSIAVGFAAFAALAWAGVQGVGGGYTALYLGITCAFSSTLLVVKLLHQRLRLDTVAGRVSVGLLIFQDIWAIIVLAAQPNFASPDLGPIAGTFAGIGFIGLFAAAAARWVLPPVFRLVAKQPELLVTAALAWCFGLGLLGAQVGVSMEMGALIAGASIAALPYAYDVVGKIANLRDFFVTLFFVALGMGIPVPDGVAVVALAGLLALATMVVRGTVFLPLLYFAGLDRRHAVEASVYLAQISEFCLVIAYIGQSLGHIDTTTVTSITLAFVATAVATPWLFTWAEPLDRVVGPMLERVGMKPRESASSSGGHHDAPRLVLLGFHRIASSLLHDIERLHPQALPSTLVVDFNVALHDAIRKTGASVMYGDVANGDTLRHAGVGKAEVIVSTVPDDLLKGTSNLALVQALRAMNPHAKIIANAVKIADVAKIQAAGADYVFMWRTEASQGLWPALDAALNGDLDELIAARTDQYGDLRDRREVLD